MLPKALDASTELLAMQAWETPPRPGDGLPAGVVVHTYFGVRCASISPEQAAVHATVVVHRALVDLRYAVVDGNDVVAEATAMRLVLTDLLAEHPTQGPRRLHRLDAPSGDPPDPAIVAYRPGGDGLERWIVAHHLYFLFNLRATAEVTAAVRSAGAGKADAAARHLLVAADYVRGFTAAMAHSAAMSRAYYRDVVRPTMSPPAAPTELTGRMQPEHQAFRRSLTALLEVQGESFDQLHDRAPALALAREALLDADLLDIERHVCVADAMVRADRSLVQHRGGADNAVATLRRMRHLRAARYWPLVRFGDPVRLDMR